MTNEVVYKNNNYAVEVGPALHTHEGVPRDQKPMTYRVRNSRTGVVEFESFILVKAQATADQLEALLGAYNKEEYTKAALVLNGMSDAPIDESFMHS